MKFQRNYHIDLIRAASILWIVIYHSWVLTGSITLWPKVLHTLVMLGGEIGVTSFFALSGYGIFCSLKKMEETGGVNFWLFLKKTLLPHYAAVLYMFFSDVIADGWGKLFK